MEKTINKEKCILVPSDFSEACDNALNHAIEMSRFLNCNVYVLHVVDSLSQNYFVKDMADLQVGMAVGQHLDYVNVSLKKLKEYVATKNNSKVIPMIKEGDLFDSVHEAAAEVNAEIIILGTHGKVGFQKIVGSYAFKVIDKSKVPVIVVQKRGFGGGFKDVVFPVSLDTEDRQKTEYAILIAEVFNSTIHIFPKDTENQANNAKLDVYVKQIVGQFDKHGVKYTVVESTDYGDAWHRQILNYSSSINADLILILSNPEKHTLFFDAKEEHIIFNSAQIPVMCVNYKKTRVTGFWGGYDSGRKNVY